MGILTKNKPATIPAAAPHSPTLADAAGRRDLPQPAATDPAAILFAALPSPPAPCPTCHCPQRWLSRYSLPPANSTTPPPATAWQCEACNLPPLPALVALRVILVDVGAGDHFATIDDVLGIPVDASQWHRLQIHHERDTRAPSHDPKSKPRRAVTTVPVRCAANCNLLADGAVEAGDEAGDEAGEGGEKNGHPKNAHETGEIFFDDRLGKIFWYAEMNGAMGRDAKPTGRIIYRDLGDWFDERDPDDEGIVRFGLAGDWASVEREVANYEKFVKPKLGKKVG